MKTDSSARIINYLAASYVLLFVFIPPMQVGTLYRLVAIACSVIFFITGNGLGQVWMNEQSKKYLFVCLGCSALMIFTSSFVYGVSVAITRNIQFIITCIVGYIGLYYFENDPEFLDKWMIVALFAILFFSITTIQGLIENPYASRIANSEWLEDRFEGNENVGLYGYVYMCILLFPMLLYKVTSRVKVNIVFDILCILDLVVIFIMGINAGYMIGIFCLLLGSMIVLMLRKITATRILVVVMISILFIMFYRDIVTSVFEFAKNLFRDNPIYQDKIRDFSELFLDGTTTGHSVDSRFSNYYDSIKDILQYPIVGSFLFGVSNGGGHSSVFDTLGKYGLLTSFLYFWIMWKFPLDIYKTKNNEYHVVKFATMTLFIIFGIFDPYGKTLSLSTLIFMPYFMFISDRHEEKQQAEFERYLLRRNRNGAF